MKFDFTRHGLSSRERFLERFFEIIPGAVSWSILLGMTALSFTEPLMAAVVVIAFDFYWLLRLFYVTIFLLLSYFRLSLEEQTDWMQRVRELDEAVRSGVFEFPIAGNRGFREKLRRWIHNRPLVRLRQKKAHLPPASEDIYHLVLLPVARESRSILEPGLQSFARGTYPASRITVILAVEERAGQEVRKDAEALCRDYRSFFMDMKVVIHPDGVPGEARVKGANITHAARQAAGYFEKKNIPFERVIVSCFDADTVVSPQYFACLTYAFMVCPERDRASFQPIPVYHNNIWNVPSFARVLEMGSSFFQLTEATNSEKLVTFSSHSMSFKALVEIGYWPIDMISDDSAIFWKAYIHYDGDYRVIPMYVTLSMDVAEAESLWKTAVSVYKQKRRWAWGVENFPIVMRAFLKNRRISLYNKARHGFKLLEGHLAWATWPFLLGIIGWLPALFAGREFSDSVLYYSVPRITGVIFNLASLCLLVTIVLSLCLLPRHEEKFSIFKRTAHALEWLLIPLIVIFLSGLPALDAQTRLMTGRYMEFWVTEKKRGGASGR